MINNASKEGLVEMLQESSDKTLTLSVGAGAEAVVPRPFLVTSREDSFARTASPVADQRIASHRVTYAALGSSRFESLPCVL